MPEYIDKHWYATKEDLVMLEEISCEILAENRSAAIRHCIRFTYRRLFKRKKPKAQDPS